MEQPAIRYARTADGADIAYAVYGTGRPVLFARQAFADAVDDIATGIDAGFVRELSGSRSVVVWDPRGARNSHGSMSLALEASLADMDAVADAVGAESFDIMAMLISAHTAIAYAAANPGRVTRMALWNPSPPGSSPSNMGWSNLPDIARTHFREYMQLSALRVYGWQNGEKAEAFVERMTTYFTPETWELAVREMGTVDATPVAPKVHARTLVIIDLAGAMVSDFVTPERQAFMRKLSSMIPACDLAVIRRGEVDQWIRRAQEFLSDDGPESAPTLPTGTALILFADIVDSAALTERIGDTAFRSASREIDGRIRTAIREHGGTPVEGKVLGDGVMGVFTSATQAIQAARACVENSGELPLHIGLHAGDVIREKDNVYGGAVNIASRICALCAPGEILVSQTVRDLARTSAGVAFEDRGEQTLKGIEDPVRLFAVRSQE